MSRREALLHVTLGVAATLLLLSVAGPFDPASRALLEAVFGMGSAAAWAASAYLYRNAKLSARVSLLAAALAGAACIVAVAPAAPHQTRPTSSAPGAQG